MAIIKDLPKEKRDEYFKRATDAGLKVPNLFLWTEETFEKKIAELECKTASGTQIFENEQNSENVNENTENVNKITENVNKETKTVKNEQKSENAKLCHICKIPIINGKCSKCGEVYGDN